MSGRRVVVIGGGVTGLTCAHTLCSADPTVQVTVLEASARLGGQVRAIDVEGTPVDVGAEAIHLGAPDAAALVRELELDQTVVGGRPGTSLLLTRRGLRPLPAGVGPTGPTRIGPVLKSGILSPAGLVRAGLEPLMRRRYDEDMGVANFVQMRFGREVADTFVDPLLGNLHSGDVHALSMRATAKQLAPVAESGESLLLRAMRRPKQAPASGSAPTGRRLPMFASWPGGLTTLVTTLCDRITAHGGSLRTGAEATGISRAGDRWRVDTSQGPLDADDVVVSVGPLAAERLLSPVAPAAGIAMSWVRTASVATVVMGFDKADAARNEVLREANGLLLTTKQAGVMKAMTNMSRKWSTLDGCPLHVLRMSVGRSTTEIAVDLDDEQMTTAVLSELRDLIQLDAAPRFTAVARFPQTMPQLGVGHLARMDAARDELWTLPGLHLAGAPADGLGLTSTTSAGRRVAREILARSA